MFWLCGERAKRKIERDINARLPVLHNSKHETFARGPSVTIVNFLYNFCMPTFFCDVFLYSNLNIKQIVIKKIKDI